MLNELVDAALWGPSGDNLQPWRIVLDPARYRVRIELDESRDTSCINAGQCMSRIACGAAAENLLHAARQCGWAAELDLSDLAALNVQLTPPRSPAAPAQASDWRARTTNRRRYDGRALSEKLVGELGAATPPQDGLGISWIFGPARLRELARLLGRTDAVFFGAKCVRKAFLRNVRLDAPAKEAVAWGLSLGSIELDLFKQLGLRLFTNVPDRLLKLCGGGQMYFSHTRGLIRSSSGLCVISARDRSPRGDIQTGRAMLRAWQVLTEKGFAVQPMMSLTGLARILEHGGPETIAALGRSKIETLCADFQRLVPEVRSAYPAAILRFGYASPASARVGRLPREKVVREIIQLERHAQDVAESAV